MLRCIPAVRVESLRVEDNGAGSMVEQLAGEAGSVPAVVAGTHEKMADFAAHIRNVGEKHPERALGSTFHECKARKPQFHGKRVPLAHLLHCGDRLKTCHKVTREDPGLPFDLRPCFFCVPFVGQACRLVLVRLFAVEEHVFLLAGSPCRGAPEKISR